MSAAQRGGGRDDGRDDGRSEGARRDVIVRLAGRGDPARFARLVEDHAMFAAYGWTSGSLADSLREAVDRGHVVAVAEVGHDPAGFVWGVPGGAFARSGYVRLVMVAAAHMGQGIADLLMDRIERELFASAPDVFLLVNEHNARAMRFYQRRGYERVGLVDDYVVAGEAEVIHRKARVERGEARSKR